MNTRRNYVLRIDKYTPIRGLKVILAHARYTRKVIEAQRDCAALINAASRELHDVLRGEYIGHLQASADRANFDAALEEMRTMDIGLIDIVPPAELDQARFDVMVSEIKRRLNGEKKEEA
jgi:hypothetical protein